VRVLSRTSRLRGRLVLAGLLASTTWSAASAAAIGPAAPAGADVSEGRRVRPTGAIRRNGGELGLFADTSIASSLTLVGFGIRGGWFARESLEIGAELQGALLLASPTEPSQRPRAGDPTAAFRFTPLLRWLPLRSEVFAASLLLGVGPAVFGSGGGVLGHAVAAPGAWVHLGGRVWLDLAIRFSLSFPGPRCRAAFAAPAAPGFCELQFGPQLGVLVVF
jgi:hypothetical protein